MSNSSSSSSSASGGIGLFGVIFVVFLVLKLAEVGVVAEWSWWWVTSPLWAPLGLVFAALAVFLAFRFVMLAVVAPIVDWRSRRAAMREFGGE